MRVAVGLLLTSVWVACAWAQAPKEDPLAKRYGIPVDLTYSPQDTPKDTLQSILSAIGRKRINYLLAHLMDPKFVDDRVKNYGGKFDELVRESTKKLTDDPSTVKDLQRFLKEGEWEEGETTASAKLKDVKDRGVFLRKIGKRWFLENRIKPEAPAK